MLLCVLCLSVLITVRCVLDVFCVAVSVVVLASCLHVLCCVFVVLDCCLMCLLLCCLFGCAFVTYVVVFGGLCMFVVLLFCLRFASFLWLCLCIVVYVCEC